MFANMVAKAVEKKKINGIERAIVNTF